MIETFRKISFYFTLALLGVYCCAKIFQLAGIGRSVFYVIGQGTILPLGGVLLLHLFLNMQRELERRNQQSILHNVGLSIVFLAFLVLFIVYFVF